MNFASPRKTVDPFDERAHILCDVLARHASCQPPGCAFMDPPNMPEWSGRRNACAHRRWRSSRKSASGSLAARIVTPMAALRRGQRSLSIPGTARRFFPDMIRYLPQSRPWLSWAWEAKASAARPDDCRRREAMPWPRKLRLSRTLMLHNAPPRWTSPARERRLPQCLRTGQLARRRDMASAVLVLRDIMALASRC